MPSKVLIVHIVHRFDFGGLENGIVNLINAIPADRVRHVVIALTTATEIASRIRHNDVRIIELRQQAGNDLRVHARLYGMLRALRPDVLHTRNIGTLEFQLVAWLARVPFRVHGEHGWDVTDLYGRKWRYRWLRRLVSLCVHRFVALSNELAVWLEKDVGISSRKVVRIRNGVDTRRFQPSQRCSQRKAVVIGTVTRLSTVKDPLNTLEAFALMKRRVGGSVVVKLVIVGDGPLRQALEQRIRELALEEDVQLVGSVIDVVPWLHSMDVFVLGSRREGISNTILEAMATGLPIVATRTGGNAELVVDGETGMLVAPACAERLAEGLQRLAEDAALRQYYGNASRARIVDGFSLDAMVRSYSTLYRIAADATEAC